MTIETVKAALADSEVEADSFNEPTPFQLIGDRKPLPTLSATMMPPASFHTLSSSPSELTSSRLYSSSLSEVTKPNPAWKLLDALSIPLILNPSPYPAPAL